MLLFILNSSSRRKTKEPERGRGRERERERDSLLNLLQEHHEKSFQ
jgi:hypothetical protein